MPLQSVLLKKVGLDSYLTAGTQDLNYPFPYFLQESRITELLLSNSLGC